jgi:NADPH-dependent F420 reductase
MTDRLILTLAILGGTGKLGGALALRWARAGYHVILGSREEAKARQAAGEANARLGSESVAAATNADAASRCDIAVLCVPYAAQASTLEAVRQPMQGKLLVCTTVPLEPKRAGVAHLPQAGSAAQEAQAALGREVPVAAAFHHVSYEHLREEGPVACDVLVCADSDEARAQTVALAEAAGLRAWQAGPLSNAGVLEGLTSILISINRRHKVHGAGILITGDPAPGEPRSA